jgi:hypothetical protein
MAEIQFTKDHEKVVAAALRFANPKADVESIIDNCIKHAARYLYAKMKERMKPSPREALAHSTATLETIRSALAAIKDWDADTYRRVTTRLGALEASSRTKAAGTERLAKICEEMRTLEQTVAYAVARAQGKIRPGAPSADKHLRGLFVAWAREWQIGTGKPIRASKLGLNKTANVVDLKPAVRAGAELRAFYALLTATGVDADNETMTYLLNYARVQASKPRPDDNEDSEDSDQEPNKAA